VSLAAPSPEYRKRSSFLNTIFFNIPDHGCSPKPGILNTSANMQKCKNFCLDIENSILRLENSILRLSSQRMEPLAILT
jgi:hypothetical protein